MILIIDDDSAIRSSLSFMLKRAKYDVQAVPGPKEAIEIVRSVAPQLILMDMNFTLSTSGEEGLTLLKQVKVFRPDVPVILMLLPYYIKQASPQHCKLKKTASFILQCTRLALSLNNIGGASTLQLKKLRLSFCSALGLHYLCTQ